MHDVMDGYVRVSRVRGRRGDSFISPADQQERIEAWARMHGVTVGRIHVDLDQSGGRRSRPGFDEMMERIDSGAVRGVIVAKLDRFFRSTLGGLDALQRLDESGARFVAIQEGVDPTTPTGRAMMSILLAMAQLHLDLAAENWLVARERAVARGVHVSSQAPTGYVRDDESGRLRPHPVFGPVIRKLFEARAAGRTWPDLARILDDHRVEGPYGPLSWRTRAVTKIIANRVYLGEARSGDYVNPIAHEPLVDRATWEAAQAAAGVSPSRGEPALLSGLLRCAGCRHTMKPDRMTVHDGQRVRIYRCRGHHASGSCEDRAAVLGRVVEPWLAERFLERVGEMEMQLEHDSTEIETALDALRNAEAELAAYRDDERIVGILGRDGFVEGLAVRARAVNDAAQRLAEVRAVASPGSVPIQGLRSMWPELTVEEQRATMRSVVDAVMLRSGRQLPIEDRALVLWRGEAPDDLPRRGLNRVAIRPFPWPDRDPSGAGEASRED